MKQRKVLVILSTKSGAGTDIRPLITPVFKKYKIIATYKRVETPPEARKIINKTSNKYDAVFVYGGDGTVVAAIKALADSGTPLLIIPGGTGNLTAKYLKLPSVPAVMVKNYCEGSFSVIYYDLAKTKNDTLALDIHIGWWANSTLSTSTNLKKRIGMLAYGFEAIRKLPAQKKELYKYRIDDGKKYQVLAYTSLFANKAIQNFFGFKLFNKPERQGTLEIAFVTSINPLRMWIWVIGRMFTGRNIGGFIKTHYARKIEILEAPNKVLFDDYEQKITFPYTVEAGYGQTKILVPNTAPKYRTLGPVFSTLNHLRYVIVEQVRNNVAGAPVYRYSQVMPKLYVGGSFRKKAAKEFTSWGVKAVVNMRRTKDPNLGQGYETLHLPTTDLTAPSIKSLQSGVEFIGKNIEQGHAVYVHCRQGRGRGPTMVAAYLISAYGMTTEQAVKHLQTVRPMTEILYSQHKRLLEYERSFKR